MKDAGNSVLITAREIQDRIAEMGRQISRDYTGRALTVIAILKGSFIFAADLIRQIDSQIPLEIDFISISSYGDSTASSGEIRIGKDIEISVEGKDVIVLEDIVDTGLTLACVWKLLTERHVQSIRVATLLEKPSIHHYPRGLDYVGFQIPDRFVFGYGLDFAQKYRNLPEIRVLEEALRG